MKKTILTLLTAFALVGITQAQTIYYINVDATGTSDGSSWANADTSLYDALRSLNTNTQVWVAKGFYTPKGSRGSSFDLGSRDSVEVYGGFNGTETSLSQRDWKTNTTILSGNIGNLLDKTDNCRTVLRGPGGFDIPNVLTIIINYGLIDGFQIRDAYSADNSNSQQADAAILMGQYCKKFTVRNCTIIDNESRESAVHAVAATIDSEFNLENCIIQRNKGRRGIGTHLEAKGFKMTATISNCLYYNNSIVNLLNFGSGSNGVITINANNSLNAKIINTTIARNTNTGQSSGNTRATIQYYTSSATGTKSIAIDNCIIWSNSGDTIGFHRHPSSQGPIDAKVRNTISEKNISTNAAVLTNVKQQDPKFTNALNFDFTLTTGSPAIDIGAASGISVAVKDLAGNDRVANGLVDMGCYEFGSTSSINSNVKSLQLRIYPNPATRKLNLAGIEEIQSVAIFDLQGKRVYFSQDVGNQIDVSNLKLGIYSIQVMFDNKIGSAKFVKN